MLNSSLAVVTHDLEVPHTLTQQRPQVCSGCFLTASPAGQGGATAAFGLVISKQTSVRSLEWREGEELITSLPNIAN